MPFVEGVGVGPKGFTRGLKKYCNVWNLCHAPEKHKHVSKCSKTLVRKIEVVVPCLSSRDWRLLEEHPSTSQWSIPWLWRQVTTERTRPAPRLTQAKQEHSGGIALLWPGHAVECDDSIIVIYSIFLILDTFLTFYDRLGTASGQKLSFCTPRMGNTTHPTLSAKWRRRWGGAWGRCSSAVFFAELWWFERSDIEKLVNL